MKRTFKPFLLFLLLVCSTLFIGVIQTSAEPLNLTPYARRIVDVETTALLGGVELRSQGIETLHNGDEEENTWVARDVHSLTAPGKNTGVRVVSWGLRSPTGFKAGTMMAIAKDYENAHPGYIVIGGVSGDFFHNQNEPLPANTKEPLNNWVSEGEVYKKDVLNPDFHSVLGFNEDRTWIDGKPTSTPNPFLKIYEDNNPNLLDSFEINAVNELSPNGITLLNPSFSGSIDTSGYQVYEGVSQAFKESVTGLQGKVYVENDNLGFYLKGRITDITNGGRVINKVGLHQFFILAKNLDEALTVDKVVKCEFDLTGAFEGVNNTMGYIYKILDNSTSLFKNYDNKSHYIYVPRARAAIGFKPDNTVVFLSAGAGFITKSTQPGPTFFELAELLKAEGCTEGYNLDGGGSASLVVREPNGSFKMLNKPADGSPREIGNGLLFVIQNPNFKVTTVTTNSITIMQEKPLINGTLNYANVLLAGKRYPFVDGVVTISNLSKNINYQLNYEYEYTYNNQVYFVSDSKEAVLTPSFNPPFVKSFKFGTKTGTSVQIKYQVTDDGSQATSKYIQYGNEVINLTENSDTITIDGLTKGTLYEFKLIVEYETGGLLKTATSDVLSYTPVAKASGGCSSASVSFISMITLLSLFYFVSKKRK